MANVLECLFQPQDGPLISMRLFCLFDSPVRLAGLDGCSTSACSGSNSKGPGNCQASVPPLPLGCQVESDKRNLSLVVNGTVLQRRRWEKAHREGIEKGAGFNWRTVSSHSVTIRK